uniref:Uncharacterized protein n=1 Tax=Avena sativa TaxID=4498 RepID=A0ACD6AD26_AVESA
MSTSTMMAKIKKLSHSLFATLLGRPWRLSSKGNSTTAAAFVPSSLLQQQHQRTVVVDVDGGLLRSSPSGLFPYFMLVALEAGGFLRGAVLLLLYPLLCCVGIGGDTALRVMAMVAFCGLRESRLRAGRAVLPKWFMEDVTLEGFEAMRGARRRVCVTRMPMVMVDGFLREYLGAEVVVARGMKVLCGFYTGLMEEEEEVILNKEARKIMMEGDAVGFSGSLEFLRHPLSHCCKDTYHVGQEDGARRQPLPRGKYLKAMVFHDGRIVFRPTAGNTLAMFMWIPFGVALGAARLVVALVMPYRYSTPILASTGMSWRLKGERPGPPTGHGRGRGQLFVCNHRTLIDPVYVSVGLDRQVRAVSYSLSRLSELISPIGRTVRLTRDRDSDGAAMARLLDRGDQVVVCPEGTTCREPYLLRFSPLFAELSDDVVPVGIAVETAMFYATTAGGFKCMDALYYMVNPRMCYTVQFLERVSTTTTAVMGREVPSRDLANLVQRKMGDALGYECTMLTRKDKYLMLAGNDGVVKANDKCSTPPPPPPGGMKNM